VEKTITVVPWDTELSGKGGYPHYMLKEIHEQPQAVRSALNIDAEEVSAVADMMTAAHRVHLLGVGTTYYVALFGQYIMAALADMEVPAASSDEFRHLDKSDASSLVLAVSQSGETYDTVMSLRHAKARGAKTAAIVNVVGSFIIGFFATLTGPDGRVFAGTTARQFVMVGLCGGYTTFSSFSLQTLNLMNDGEWLQASANIGGSVILCMFAVWAGHILAVSLNAMKWV